MAVVFRPTSVAVAAYSWAADRLGRSMGGGGARSQILDGFLFRAVRAGGNVIVYGIDPEAVWVFLHQASVSGFGAHLKLATRAYNRDLLAPGTTQAVDAPVANSTGTVLLPFAPGQGYYPSIDAGALFIPTTVPTVPHVDQDVVTTCALAGTSGNIVATFDTDRFQVWADTFEQRQPKFYAPGTDTSDFIAYYHRIYAWLVRESGLATITGDADARYYTRQATRYSYSIPQFAAQCTRNGLASHAADSLWLADPIVAGAYVSQPTGSDTPGGDPAVDPARYGIAGTFISRLKRPEVPPTNSYALSLVQSYARLMTANPEPELVPPLVTVTGVNRYATHGVSGVGACYTLSPAELADPADGLGSRGTIHLFSTVHCFQDPLTWTAVQLESIEADDTVTAATLYKGSAAKGHLVGPEIDMFGVAGIAGASYDIVAGKVVQNTVDLLHYGVDGVLRTTGLRAAGWYVFTQYLLNTVSPRTGTLYGQASLHVAYIGDGKVAVLARDYDVDPLDTTVDWTLVVLDQLTGAFIEARGLVGAGGILTYNAHISVITPESTDGAVTTPAVLLCTLGTTHRLSTDGGLTWVIVFTGFTGVPLYLGNQLHKIAFGEGL